MAPGFPAIVPATRDVPGSRTARSSRCSIAGLKSAGLATAASSRVIQPELAWLASTQISTGSTGSPGNGTAVNIIAPASGFEVSRPRASVPRISASRSSQLAGGGRCDGGGGGGGGGGGRGGGAQGSGFPVASSAIVPLLR